MRTIIKTTGAATISANATVNSLIISGGAATRP